MKPLQLCKCLLLLCLLASAGLQQAYGQSKHGTLKGIVTSQTDSYLGDVTITVFNRSGQLVANTATDSLGMFEISMLEVDSIYAANFSRVGYKPKKVDNILIKAKGNSILTRLERQDTSALSEVVVVAYGIQQKKANIVGSVTTVDPKELTVTSGSFTTSFAGKISGMIAVQSSGQPGADAANFWIRGISTFGANTRPLIVLDGVEILADMLNSLAPESIKSFSVLKDATATALYGSRGANGVLIITTKTGGDVNGKMVVNVRVQGGMSQATRMTPVADGVYYMQNYNEARQNEGKADYYSQDKINGTINKLNPYAFPNNNWHDLLFKDETFNQNANVSVSGGGSKVNYFLNAAVYNENGILKDQPTGSYNTNVNNKKYMFQSNVSASITPTTRVGVKMNTQIQYTHQPFTAPDALFNYSQTINQTDFPAFYPSSLIADAQPGITYYGNAPNWDGGATQNNPLATLNKGYRDIYLSYLTTVFNLDQDLPFITRGLKARVLASFYNRAYADQNRTNIPTFKTLNGYTVDASGNYNLNLIDIGPPGSNYFAYNAARDGDREANFQGSLEYDTRIGDAHNINALILYHQKQADDNGANTTETGILTHREQGLAGRLTYNYDNRYLLESNFGYTGSENFVQGHRYGFFPSIAAGWTVSNEQFWDGLKRNVHFLKFRASYGKAGNDALNIRFPYLTTISPSATISNFYVGPNYVAPLGINLTGIGNPNATWEVSTKTDIGLEIGLFNKLNIIVDLFQDKRERIFMQRSSIPNYVGYDGTLPYANIGEMINRGIDASIEYSNRFSKDFFLSFRGAFTWAHNEVVNKDEPPLIYKYQSVIGHPYNTVYGLVALGLFADEDDIAKSPQQTFTNVVKPGDIKYKDLNGDNKVDGNDVTAIGNPTIPEIVYGFGPSIKFKKFDMSFYFQGTAKVSLLMTEHHPFTNGLNTGFNIAEWISASHWSSGNPNPNAAYPRLSTTTNPNNVQTSSFFVYNASFLRLKTAEIGYTIKKLRVFATGTNLLTFSKFKYWDPELGGGNGLSYPLQRTVNIGAQYNFN
jgi:TonB-linked SusC/RagA family outer membrane protein